MYDFEGCEPQFYWNKCACNEFDALCRRHNPENLSNYVPGNQHIVSVEKEIMSMARELQPFNAAPYTTVIENTRPSIKARYKRAHYNITNKREYLNPLMSRISAFVKYEKIPIGKFAAGKAPRLIQYRTFEYLYLLKKSILPHELQLKSANLKWNGQSVNTILTKLQDNYGCASVLRTHWDAFTEPVAVCLDHKSFDGHYVEELLGIEKKYWESLSSDSLLKTLLEMQFNNKGRTQNGLRYKTKAKRMSGEYTTSTGNSIINYAMLVTWLKVSGISNFRVVVNGDDSVCFMERKELKKLQDLNFFNNFNMETECDRIVHNFQEISYCQASPIRVMRNQELVWFMVKSPIRSMSRLSYCDSKFYKCASRFRLSTGLCELAISSGVPVMQALSLYILSTAGTTKPLGSVDKIPAKHSGNLSEVKNISSETRCDFEMAFGITIDQQLQWESELTGKIRSTQDLKQFLAKYKKFILN